jgi:hypothetical protein
MEALQTVMLGKIPVNIISPIVLQRVLKNISLYLPDGYELVVNPGPHELAWYYENVQVAVIANSLGFTLILSIPIKDVYRRYELYYVYNFYSEIPNGTFVKYNIEKEYLAVHALQHTYLTLSSSELSQCSVKDLKICAVNLPVYSTDVKTCAVSLYLVSGSTSRLQEDSVHRCPPPTLRRHGPAVIYHFVKPQQVHIRCRQQ